MTPEKPFTKQTAAHRILIIGIIIQTMSQMILYNRSWWQQILVFVVSLFSLFMTGLSNSGMSSVPSPRDWYDIARLHVFYAPTVLLLLLFKFLN